MERDRGRAGSGVEVGEDFALDVAVEEVVGGEVEDGCGESLEAEKRPASEGEGSFEEHYGADKEGLDEVGEVVGEEFAEWSAGDACNFYGH